MEVIQYDKCDTTPAPVRPGRPGRVRVVRPKAVRLRPPLDEHLLPCCGYPGPVKIPLCGDLQCRHLPCYTWHRPRAALPDFLDSWLASTPSWLCCEDGSCSPLASPTSPPTSPAYAKAYAKAYEPAADLTQEHDALKEMELERPRPPSRVADIKPVHATVTTPGGTVTLYKWPDADVVADAPRLEEDDGVLVVEEQPAQPEQPARRGRRAVAKPRKQRTPRKPRKTKADAVKDAVKEVLAEGIMEGLVEGGTAPDADTRGMLVRALGLLCSMESEVKAEEGVASVDGDLGGDDLPANVRRVLREVAKALM